MRHLSKRHTSFFSVKTIALLLIVTLTSVTTITHITKVSATEDVTPPVLHDVWVSPSTVNDGESVTVYAQVTDDISGTDRVDSRLYSPSMIHTAYAFLQYNASSDLWEGEATIPAYSEGGTWTIYQVYCWDVAGNFKAYTHNIDYIGEFTVIPREPWYMDADLNDDDVVNVDDWLQFKRAYKDYKKSGLYDVSCDFDTDGDIDSNDRLYFKECRKAYHKNK